MEVRSPTSRKPDLVGAKIRELFPTLISLHGRWIDLTSVGAQAANDLVNTLVRIKYVYSIDESWKTPKFDL